jgi:amino acid adenylation domain-containing protein
MVGPNTTESTMHKNDKDAAVGEPMATGTGYLMDGETGSLHGLIALQTVRTPDLEAVRCGDASLTYAELDRKANQCAHYLRELGVGPDSIVGVHMERSLDMVVALLAILKAGGAYLPIDTGYPEARLAFVLDDADLSVVLTQQRHVARLAGFAGTVLPLDGKADFLARYPGSAPRNVTRPHDLAYVIYTSGSTGQPKGCLLPHGAICNRLLWMQDEYGLRPGDRVLQKTPYTFDVSVWEFFWPLLAGAKLVLAAPNGHKDSHYLVQLIRAEGITVCHFVPSMLRFFLGDGDAALCTSLRHVFTSGEALPYDLVRRFKDLLPARLHNLYGPTEAAVDVSYWECILRPDGKVPIGRAIRNVRLHVLDPHGRPVARGTEGELYIAGACLARGYLRRPQLTAERFVDDPFHPGGKMYRTGDRVVELLDGNIDFLGRVDFQVKLRGLRIELGEVETVLRRHEGVREAVVLVRGEDEGDPKLVAYLEAGPGAAVEPRQVRRFAGTHLPDYMVPSLVLVLPQLPVGAHGKLDRNALPWPVPATGAEAPAAPPSAAPPAASAPQADPAPAQAAQVAARIGAAVAAVLKQPEVAADADLFDLGATSLTLVRLAEQVRKEFGIAVPLDVFLDAPTVAGVAAYVARESAKASPAAAALPEGSDRIAVPLADLLLPRVAYRVDACLTDSDHARLGGGPVPLEALAACLGMLVPGIAEDGPKYRYPSGGGLNPVRTYVYVKEGGVAGLAGGAYYHHPQAHALYRVGDGAALPAGLFGAEAALFDQAAFALVFVAEMDAIEPLYQQASAALVTLEAGYMSQLLLTGLTPHGLAGAPATGLEFDRLVASFGLAASERFVHCLLVGAPGGAAAQAASRPVSAATYGARSCVRHDAGQLAFAAGTGVAATSEQLHNEQRHLRRMPADAPSVALPRGAFDWSEHRLRASCRAYAAQPVSAAQLGRLLGMVRGQGAADGRRYLYGGVGPARELVIFVYVRNGTMPEGLYRYDADGHRLAAAGPLTVDLVEQIYTPYNRKHFKQCAFCLFVFGPAGPDRQAALHAGLLDAGHLGQLLLERQAEFDLGLCPIGAIRYERIRAAFPVAPHLELLHSFVGGVAPRAVPPQRRRIEAAPPTRAGADGVAIIGIGGRYPGAADVRGFWHNLRDGVASIGPLPSCRRWSDGAGAAPPGGYLPDIACFDSLPFGIAPVEARGLDPQERLLLEEVWTTLEDAGYTAPALAAGCRRVGVFVGAMWNDYQSVGLENWHRTGKVEEFSHHASLANRISHVFDFAGPSVAVNTSCASGITALHLAAESIRRGECDAAIVAGVNLLAHPYHARLLADLGLLSADGCARPLSADANGWVPGEGVGVVVLKSLGQAERDGDHVHAVIEASLLGHSGRSSRYGAPNARRQADNLRRLLADAGLTPADIDYIEAAAPGASMADAAELNALAEVFGQAERAAPCFVGTVKANIGHLESASGLSQLTKVVLQMAHGELAPVLNSEPRNPLIALDERTLLPVTRLTSWPGGGARPRRALINSIGAAGSAGHLIVAEYQTPPRAPASGGRQAVVLSAATAGQLRLLTQRLHAQLAGPGEIRLDDLAFTLRAGRVAMRERVAVVADAISTLRDRLQGFVEGAAHPDVVSGTVDEDGEGAARAFDDPAEAAAAWVQGVAIDWRVFDRPGQRRIALPTYPFEAVPHWLGEARDAGAAQALPGAPDDQAAAAGASAQAQLLEERTQAYLVQQLAQATGIDAARIGVDRPLEALGLNSMIIQELNARMARAFPALPKTVFFEHRTLRSLAGYLLREQLPALLALHGMAALPAAVQAAPRAARQPALAAAPAGQDIAIVGLAGRYPHAETLDEFWRNLAEGRDCIDEVPAERWDTGRDFAAVQGARSSRWGGFLRDADAFDPLFFNIAPLEAERMDPQERLVLQAAWHAFEDAGYSRSALDTVYGGKVGVFIGVMYSEYQLFPRVEQGLGINGSYGTIANRVSYVLNLRGPSMAVDTMCSSSLTAIHLACESIRRGECECALAGGVNLSLHPNKYVTHALLNMPASDGRCRSFGAGGDGFVPGEGVGTVVLKPLARALADGDQIYGVIKASVVNHGGKTNGYTVPNPDAQQELVGTALRRAGIDARLISYFEAHGTGTALGDPIEIAGLSRAFADYTDDRQFCAIGSVKSNIGHAEAAAGIAGLTKVLLQMRHGKLVPSLHAREPNPNIDFAATPFAVQHELAEWTRPVVEIDGERRTCPRIAGISSFGAGGANAHLIVEEYRPAQAPSAYRLPDGQPALIVLSAKNDQRLRASVAQLLAALESGALNDLNLADAAYTLQVGREPLETRLAVAATSAASLRERLQAVLPAQHLGDAAGADVHYGDIRKHRDELADLNADGDLADWIVSLVAKGKHGKLLASWARGLAFDWNLLYGERKPCRISLPTYPFARDRYWIAAPAPASVASARGADATPPRPGRAGRFDQRFFEKLFKDLDSDVLSVESAIAELRKKK